MIFSSSVYIIVIIIISMTLFYRSQRAQIEVIENEGIYYNSKISNNNDHAHTYTHTDDLKITNYNFVT